MGLEDSHGEKLRRREALITLGGLGAGGLLVAARGPLGLVRAETADAAATCVLTPEVTEGPYWIANGLTRRDITSGQAGIPLLLYLTVEDSSTCEPIGGADVELWHANRLGAYSGVNGNSQRYLRGHQKSNSKGLVIFKTIYPGWYRGRTPHIHVKVHVGGSVVHTGQLFFADTVSGAVYKTSRYKSHGQADTKNAADSIYADAGGSRSKLRLTRRSGSKGYLGTMTMIVQS
jgi:protocatechuate 3,4-dioxygenase beta subunit